MATTNATLLYQYGATTPVRRPKETTFHGSTHHQTKGGQEVDSNENSCLLHRNFESESVTCKYSQEAETFPVTTETLAPEDVDVREKTNVRHEAYSNTTPDTDK